MRDHVGIETFTFEELEGALATGMNAGGVETWDRFAAMLAGD